MDERREARYARVESQLRDLVEAKSPSLLAAMATVAAVLHGKMRHHLWTGFYLVVGEDELHVGPYQGPVACQILRGRGACLLAARTREPVVLPDVAALPDHVVCDPRARSEIVLPLVKGDRTVAVLDVDSATQGALGQADVEPLSRILSLLSPYL